MEIKINLIPPSKKEEIRKKNQIGAAAKAGFFLGGVLVVFSMMIFSFNYILKLNLDAVSLSERKSENSGRFDKLKEFDANFSQANRKISDVISIKKSQLYWSRLFLKLNSIIFPGIKINSITTSDYSVSLSGISDTRDNLILFKDKLSSEKCFFSVSLPLDDLVDKNNIIFKIDFLIDKNCLKNQ